MPTFGKFEANAVTISAARAGASRHSPEETVTGMHDHTSQAEFSLVDSQRILLAHEWIASIGGSENVFRELMALFPSADAVCLWNDVPDTFDRVIGESRLASSRLRQSKAASLPFMPRAWRAIDVRGYHAVLASSHAFAHHLAGHAARAGVSAFAYIHTPARYIWAPEVEARGQSIAARAASIPLRRVDRRATDGKVNYAANSFFIRDRIRRAWDLDATVIYPPVNVDRIMSVPRWIDELTPSEVSLFDSLPGDGFVLGASRLVEYKRLDKAIEVGELLGLPVVIAGHGPDEQVLREIAAEAVVPVHFTGRVSDAQLYALYQQAALFVFMAIEDFGIMPVEAMAAGAPVLVNAEGGAKESVQAIGGGVAVADSKDNSLLAKAADSALGRIDHARRETVASTFGVRRFGTEIQDWIRSGDRSEGP